LADALLPSGIQRQIWKGMTMSRSKAYGLVLALLASAALSTACTRNDPTGPSTQPQASLDEGQGANNHH
jgi:hypothetical protein